MINPFIPYSRNNSQEKLVLNILVLNEEHHILGLIIRRK